MEGSASASAKGAGSPASARPKRSRTGCMTCRNRRRKCDEGKPTCQNCITKGLKCRYPVAFQILGKHNFTPEIKTGVKYANVRFAGDASEEPVLETTTQSTTAAGRQQDHHSTQTQSIALPDEQAETNWSDASPQIHLGNILPSNSYEFTPHGLLALGTGSENSQGLDFASAVSISEEQAISTLDFARMDKANIPLEGSILQKRREVHRTEIGHEPALSFDTTGPCTPCPSSGSQTLEFTQDLERPQEASRSNAKLAVEAPPVQAVTVDRSIELLKFYRYNIAPWLDICDTNQYFGVTLLLDSKQIPSLRACVMRLAAASSNMLWFVEDLNIGNSTSGMPPNDSITSDAAAGTTMDVLDVLADVVPNLAAFWLREDRAETRIHLFERLSIELYSSNTNACTYWLLVRLELARALMAGNNRISLPFSIPQSGETRTNDSITQYAYDSIALCADSVIFAQGDDDPRLQQRYGLNQMEMWKTLVQGFAHWYIHRSQAFEPIIELYPKDGVLTDDEYPTIVFTSGAALLANQLYHTGMLLLLQNKPRFVDKLNQNSPSMSTLWHAHRICGIAIQNDILGCWDPCLVASLIVAGRTATHTSQQNAIVRTLESVQQLTGWIIIPYIEQLKTEWQLADGL